MRRAIRRLALTWLTAVVTAVFFAFPTAVLAEKGITLSASNSNVEVDKFLDVPIYIDTGTDTVNAVGFNIDFPTENLEGLTPNRAGSVFPMWVTESATRIDCGITGQQAYKGRGLVTTLRFKGRTAGSANISLNNIKVLFAGISVVGFTANNISITVYGASSPPPEDPTAPSPNKVTLKPPTIESSPTDTGTGALVAQPVIPIPGATTTFGALAQVSGKKGSTEEEPLKPAEVIEASVKGIFSKGSMLWTSVLPTILLLIIIVFLGIRLYLSERNRHLRMEHLLDKQLGTLAALESKIEIVEQKGAEGRDLYIKELQMAKAEVAAESGEKKPEAAQV